jgi:small-conductance mechanosensitive channel
MPENENLWEVISYFYTEVVLFNIQNVGVTLSHLVVALFSVIIAMILSAVVRSVLRKKIFKRLKLDKGMEYALLKFTHYVILIIGIYVGLQSINIPLGALVGLFAVIGVGIGFGLQNLAANFTSGLILLIERPVKIGDRLELEGVWGDVVKINLRTTVINTPDDISIIVPNSKLLDENVTNFSYGNPRIRIRVNVGIAYGSDVDLATRLLIEAAEKNSRVMATPKPSVLFREFGDSSLDFQLLCWIPSADCKFLTISELNYAIDKAFRENGVEIPFPQRDLHIRSSRVRFSPDQA